VPEEIGSLDRWFLLDSPENPARPWELLSPIRVYSLALELGSPGSREWLVYSFAPLEPSRRYFHVSIPGGPDVEVLASRAGCFTRITERGSVNLVGDC